MEPKARLPSHVHVPELLEGARKRFFADANVIGVGTGLRRRRGKVLDEAVLTIYVKEKLPREKVPAAELVPDQFEDVPTDVVAPFASDYVKEPLEFGTIEHWQHSRDMSSIDRGRIHEHALEQRKKGGK